MDFFEPEDKYKTDKDLEKNTKNKTTALSLFLILTVLLLVIVQRDIFSFSIKSNFKENCDSENTYTRMDHDGLELGKINKTLKDNQEAFSQIEGYIKVEIEKDGFSGQSKRNYSIHLFIEEGSTEAKNFPDFVCGHKLIIEEK